MSQTETNQTTNNTATEPTITAETIIYDGRHKKTWEELKNEDVNDYYQVNKIFSFSSWTSQDGQTNKYIIVKVTKNFLFIRRLKQIDDYKISDCGGFETYKGRLYDDYYKNKDEVINKISKKKLYHVHFFHDNLKYEYKLEEPFIYTYDFGN
jgi:hypothetical protein